MKYGVQSNCFLNDIRQERNVQHADMEKSESTMASELRCRLLRMRADFMVGRQCNQKLNAFTPVLSQPMKTFYFLTILLQSNIYQFIVVDV